MTMTKEAPNTPKPCTCLLGHQTKPKNKDTRGSCTLSQVPIQKAHPLIELPRKRVHAEWVYIL
jgi:hypothetical protein